jgi:hypothetical protein
MRREAGAAAAGGGEEAAERREGVVPPAEHRASSDGFRGGWIVGWAWGFGGVQLNGFVSRTHTFFFWLLTHSRFDTEKLPSRELRFNLLKRKNTLIQIITICFKNYNHMLYENVYYFS